MFCWCVMAKSIWYQVDVLDDTTCFWTCWAAVKSVRWLRDWTQSTGKEEANLQVEKRFLSCGNSKNAQKWALITINNHKNKKFSYIKQVFLLQLLIVIWFEKKNRELFITLPSAITGIYPLIDVLRKVLIIEHLLNL